MPVPALRINGIPALGFGTYPLTGAAAFDAVSMALELGYRHIDTAQIYDNEPEVGRAIAASGLPRSELFVTSKVPRERLSQSGFLPSVRQSLADLRLERLDLLLIHWPPLGTPSIEAAIDWLNEAAEAGLTERIGISNFTVAMMQEAAARSPRKLATNQVELHPLLDQSRLKAAADALGIPLSAYCPLARGAAVREPTVVEIGKARGVSPSAVALGWILQQGVIALPMSTRREHAEANLDALSLHLTDDEMARIGALTKSNRRLVAGGEMASLWDR